MSKSVKWNEGGRICSRCKLPKPWDEFNWKRQKKNQKTPEKIHTQKQPQCKSCSILLVTAWRKEQSPERIKDLYYKRTYGMSLSEFNHRFEFQKQKCLICSKQLQITHLYSDSVVVDHCHTTGKVRGLLCNECNRGLGYFRDNIASLTNAIAYLQGEFDALHEKS